MNLNLKYRLLLAFVAVLFLSIISISVSLKIVNDLKELDTVKSEYGSSELRILEIKTDLNEFMTSGFKQKSFQENRSSEFLSRIDSNLSSLGRLLHKSGNYDVISENISQSELQLCKDKLGEFESNYQKLVELYEVKGFKKNGKVGELRSAIHKVEERVSDKEMIEVLMLRRHEKDFFLRLDKKYVGKFNKRIDALISSVSNNSPELVPLLNKYKSVFNEVADIERKAGYTSKSGIKNEIYTLHKDLSKDFSSTADLITEKFDSFVTWVYIIMLGMFFIQLAVGLILSFKISSKISTSTISIRDAVVELSEGTFPEELVISSQDEIGDTENAFNQLMERLKVSVAFSNDLGEGKLDSVYDESMSDDVLAKSIIRLQSKLREANKEQELINWTNRGLAEFNSMIQNDDLKLEELGDAILSFVVSYLDANQGAIYLSTGEEEKERYLDRLSTYAYDKKKFVEDRIKYGQGLAGQCAIEGLPINIKDVPKNYVNITSGLGEATPGHIYITPLIVRDEIFGVFELASFSNFKSHQLEFIEKLTEIIANVLSSKRMTILTNKLLEETRERAEIMMQQEEELKQTNEEIQATREDLESRVNELERENQRLRSNS